MSRKGGNPNIQYSDRTPTRTGINASIENGLHNDLDPTVLYAKENPQHRAILECYLVERSIKETALKMEVGRWTVKNVIRQPWARKILVERYKEIGEAELRKVFGEIAPDAIWNIVDLGNEAESEAVKLAANREILDRYLGKPKESLVVSQKPASEMSDDELKTQLLGQVNRS